MVVEVFSNGQNAASHFMHMACGGEYRDCARRLRNLETAQGACAIPRLRKASYPIPRMVRKVGIPRLRKFLDCVELIYFYHLFMYVVALHAMAG